MIINVSVKIRAVDKPFQWSKLFFRREVPLPPRHLAAIFFWRSHLTLCQTSKKQSVVGHDQRATQVKLLVNFCLQALLLRRRLPWLACSGVRGATAAADKMHEDHARATGTIGERWWWAERAGGRPVLSLAHRQVSAQFLQVVRSNSKKRIRVRKKNRSGTNYCC